MLNLDPAKLLVMVVLGLVVVGPEKLPSLARQLSGAWRTVTKYREQFEGEIKRLIPDLDLPRVPTNPSAKLSGFVSDLIRQPNGERAVVTATGSAAASRSNAAAESLGQSAVDERSAAANGGFGASSDVPGRTRRADDPAMN